MADIIERRIRELESVESRPALEGLEADVWAGVAARRDALRTYRVLLGVQAAVLTFAFLGSVVVGNWVAASDGPNAELAVFSSQLEIAPSTLLIGRET